VFLPVDKKVQLNLNPTILCVDDDPGVLRMLASMFLKADAGLIQTTSDSKSVPAYLEEHPEVDMVLTDIVMPGLDGWQLFAKIKARFPLLPVILYSGYPDKLAHKPDGVVRPDYILAKPVTLKVLMQAINSIGRMRL
ncbi:MAG: response regulator, partial [Proteobacteria bacterium]|nr:response regulator [Pseudomonadota bacterium]